MDELMEQLVEALAVVESIIQQINDADDGGEVSASLARACVRGRFARASTDAPPASERRPRPVAASTLAAVRGGILPVSHLGAAAFARSGPYGLTEIDRMEIARSNAAQPDKRLHLTEQEYAASRDRIAGRSYRGARR